MVICLKLTLICCVYPLKISYKRSKAVHAKMLEMGLREKANVENLAARLGSYSDQRGHCISIHSQPRESEEAVPGPARSWDQEK